MAKRRGKGNHEGGDGQERWLLTYADLITLLMVFFIVMYALSQADLDKFEKLSTSMQQAFNPGAVLPGGASSSTGRAVSGNSSEMERDYRTFQEELEAFNEQGMGGVTGGGMGGVSVEMSREGIVIRAYGNILFESGKATLQQSSQAFLTLVTKRLRSMPNKVRIEGHCDSIPIQGPLHASNWELSTARALALVHYLSDAGVAPYRLGAVGYGEFRPLASNDTREGRARNRRVDIVILYPDVVSSAEGLLAEERRH